jgi:hypothetical protein
VDKENLHYAWLKMEEVAWNVNEGQQCVEVIKEVLSAKKKPVVNVSVNVTHMKLLRHAMGKPGGVGQNANGEAVQVARMQGELKHAVLFAQQFAKDIVDWAKTMLGVMWTLRVWMISFGKVIGLSLKQESEAFDAFMELFTLPHLF